MIADQPLRVVALLVAVTGCKFLASDDTAFDPIDAAPDGAADAVTDTAPPFLFQPFNSVTWSLSTMNGATQLSITDGSGAAACALSVDQQHSLGAAGVQIIMQFAEPVTDPCPSGHHPVSMNCAATLGSNAYVPAGCAFYRQWNAQGQSVGIAAAINGEVTINGNASSCAIRANIGFLGNSYAETLSLVNGAGAQPWCGS